MIENTQQDKKSLRCICGKSANYQDIAKDCVAFANAQGGKLFIGIEDESNEPPENQKITEELLCKLQKRISELTVNVSVIPYKKEHTNGGEFIELLIQQSKSTIACTNSAQYYIRIGNESKRLYPEDLQRLHNDKSSYAWETKVSMNVPYEEADQFKLKQFFTDITSSERVSDFIKEKNNYETLDYYNFIDSRGLLTNLGILWIGKREHRARLLYGPVIQFIKYDSEDNKVVRKVWDDYTLNPKEMIEAVWNEIPDWKENIEISDGLFRKTIPAYDEIVIRELIANALAHRLYTIRGDIFIDLYPQKLVVKNPGVFPLGVSAENILQKTVRRNDHICKVFYDLKLMEREGSGYDKMYETLLSFGKPIPIPFEGDDFVSVTIKRQIISSEAVKVMDNASRNYQLRSKEIICLGLIAQYETLNAVQLSKILYLTEKDALRSWLGRLPDLRLILSRGKTKGTVYYVNPELLRKAHFKGKTTLKKIEPYRIKELIREDLMKYQSSSISEINQRIGKEIPDHRIREQLSILIEEGILKREGFKRGTIYIYLKNNA